MHCSYSLIGASNSHLWCCAADFPLTISILFPCVFLMAHFCIPTTVPLLRKSWQTTLVWAPGTFLNGWKLSINIIAGSYIVSDTRTWVFHIKIFFDHSLGCSRCKWGSRIIRDEPDSRKRTQYKWQRLSFISSPDTEFLITTGLHSLLVLGNWSMNWRNDKIIYRAYGPGPMSMFDCAW